MTKRFAPLCTAIALAMSLLYVGCSSKSSTTTPPQTKILLVHAAAGGPDSIDILSYNGSSLATIAYNQPYLTSTGYLDASAGTYLLLVDTAKQLDDDYLTYQQISLSGGNGYSFFVYDSSATVTRTFLVNEDLTAPGADSSNVRFFHLSPDASRVDVAIGNDILYSSQGFYEISSSSLAFKKRLAGSTSITVYEAGTTNVLATLPEVVLKANTSYSIFISGFTITDGGKKPLSVRIIPHTYL
ncbi:protein of unknown function [Filimonas lacunae]|uniref:DUF4397 domain-containing protein n=2 Tax=Filimonas lacunae TaxID=477680 RepID=A0A1N7Q8K0_9BACT|nr:protein of unknown function [Filimonas lacunae]